MPEQVTVAETAAAPDQAARDRITEDLDTTLFVEAGAGSGKTSALVERVLALVMGGRVELRRIAAITFTEKAGAELRDRIRAELEKAAEADPDGEVGERCRAALDQLDGAAIGTLHSFAQRLLSEHPVEAGLPPRVEVLDEVSSTVAFDAPLVVIPRPAAGRPLARADRAAPLRRWRPARAPCSRWPRPSTTTGTWSRSGSPRQRPSPRRFATSSSPPWRPSAMSVPSRAATRATSCGSGSTRSPPRMAELAAIDGRARPARGPRAAGRSEAAQLQGRWNEARRPPGPATSMSSGPASARRVRGWKPSATRSPTRAPTDSAAPSASSPWRAPRTASGRASWSSTICSSWPGPCCVTPITARPCGRPCTSATTGCCSTSSRTPTPSRSSWPCASPPPTRAARRRAASRGTEVDVAPGHLFVVGDPKQSIYRFRRADISTFLRAAERFGSDGGGRGRADGQLPDRRSRSSTGSTTPSPPSWASPTTSPAGRLAARVPRPGGRPAPLLPPGPPVAVLGRHEHPAGHHGRRAPDGRGGRRGRHRHPGRWTRGGTSARQGDGTAGARPGSATSPSWSRPAPRCPSSRTPSTQAGIAFRAETSSLVYASRAVRDLLMVLRAVDDPTNHLHIVSALRTPLLACGDDDLFRFKWERKGRWSYLADQPDTVPARRSGAGRPELPALALRRSAPGWPPPSCSERIARDRRAMELGFAEGRPRDVWRRLRFVIDQARAWSEATGGNLRQYLHWVAAQTAEGARVAESILPESDDDAVRIMTIHGAKGLEFPITIVSGMSTVPSGRPAPAEVVFPADRRGRLQVRQQGHAPTSTWTGRRSTSRWASTSGSACCTWPAPGPVTTWSCPCTARRGPSRRRARSAHQRRAAPRAAWAIVVDDLPDAATTVDVLRPAVVAPPTPPPPFAEWAAERTDALRRAARPTTVAATALTDEGEPDSEGEPDPGLQKRPRDLDLPPWLKGRYGTAVGRAVHGVLQTIDLATGAGLDEALAAQCEAEAVPDRADDVRDAGAARRSGPRRWWRRPRSPHWREIYACTPRRRAAARGVHRPPLPRPRRPGRGGLQDGGDL